MEVQFSPRDQGWRQRGRPPRKVSPAIRQMLQDTYQNGTQAVIPLTGTETPAEVAEVIAEIKRGAKDLDKHLRYQRDLGAIRFYVEDK